jgi:hypothetical protein
MLGLAVLTIALAGCGGSGGRSDARDKGLLDPMNYNPAGNDRTDVSGGGFFDFDKKAFNKDVNDVLSP